MERRGWSITRRHVLRMLFVVAVLGFGVPVASASPIVIPPSLAPGSTYYLVFVTSQTTSATSTSIGTYNTDVTTDAAPIDAALGIPSSTNWFCICSTGATAQSNIENGGGPITAPIYNLNGQLVATGDSTTTPGLFGQGLLDNPMDYNQQGVLTLGSVWTGLICCGLAAQGHALGSPTATLGLDFDTDGLEWIEGASASSGPSHLYGLSGPLVVPTPVPEPGTVSLMLTPAVLLLGRYRPRRRKLATPAALCPEVR